jgi:hypothetical protein
MQAPRAQLATMYKPIAQHDPMYVPTAQLPLYAASNSITACSNVVPTAQLPLYAASTKSTTYFNGRQHSCLYMLQTQTVQLASMLHEKHRN